MIEDKITYLNRNGFPIIRRCQNCKHWSDEIRLNKQNLAGYCKANPMFFAFTLSQSVYPITKDFYLCESHEFENEEFLRNNSESVNLKDSLKRKEDID